MTAHERERIAAVTRSILHEEVVRLQNIICGLTQAMQNGGVRGRYDRARLLTLIEAHRKKLEAYQ